MQPSEKPLFKARKRNTQKKRKRRLDSALDTANATTNEADDEKSHHDLLLLKEAQKLREQSRQSGLTPSLLLTSATNSSAAGNPDNAIKRNDVADGLQSHFSVEKAGTAVEERMAKYIEEGMRSKFGDRYIGRSNAQKENSAKEIGNGDDTSEDLKQLNADMFDIPQHLQVEQRRLYDPSEGMPSAGLEETEVVPSVKDFKGNDDPPAGEGIGNERDDERNEYNHVRWLKNDKRPSSKARNNSEAGLPSSSRRHPQHADAGFAERFRKRWKQQ